MSDHWAEQVEYHKARNERSIDEIANATMDGGTLIGNRALFPMVSPKHGRYVDGVLHDLYTDKDPKFLLAFAPPAARLCNWANDRAITLLG